MAKWIVGVVLVLLTSLAMPAHAGRWDWSIGYSDYGWGGGYSVSLGRSYGGYGGWHAPAWYAPSYRVVHDRWYPRYGYPRYGYRYDPVPRYRYYAPHWRSRYDWRYERDWRHSRHERWDRYWNDRRDRASRDYYDRRHWDRGDRYRYRDSAYDRSRYDARYNAHDDAWRGQRERHYD